MGCASSSEAAAAPSAHAKANANANANASATLVVALGASYCAEKPSTLYMKERCWSVVPPDEDFLIRHVESTRALFCVQGAASAAAMKTLRLASTRAPVAHLKRDSIARAPTFNVFAAGPVPAKLLSIDVRCAERPFVEGGGCAFVSFTSPETGDAFAVGVEGDWAARRALLWLERRDKRHLDRRIGRRLDAARVYRPSKTAEQVKTGARQDDYFVGVAAGVDMALVLLVCMALDAADRETAVL